MNDHASRSVHDAAQAYVQAGLSLIPIWADGSKRPAFDVLPLAWCERRRREVPYWRVFRERRPTAEDLQRWFVASPRENGMAILGGAVSGGLEILDLDNGDAVQPWCTLVEQRAPGLLRRLPRVQTPRPGMHVYYRTAKASASMKLAQVPDPKRDGKKPKTLIEFKGEGGYCLAPPSPPMLHPSYRAYVQIGEVLLPQVPVITDAERSILHECARQLSTWQAPRRPRPRQAQGLCVIGRPGDDYNARADWADILEPHGWTYQGEGGDGCDHWCRPDKHHGTSATTNYDGNGLLFVFSTNADPFEEGRGYTKFSAYALLNHGGDFHAAARALAAQGYGRGPHAPAVASPFARYASYVRRQST